MAEPLVRIDGVSRVFGGGHTLLRRPLPAVHAVQDVSLDVAPGETLGIVGESGCGKSTLARMLVGLDGPTRGAIRLGDTDLVAEGRRDPAALARRAQYVFQDPIASLNPRKTIRAILEAPLGFLCGLRGADREARLQELMAQVNLAPEFLDRYPHEFSGGQAQRIGIARALAPDPALVVLDEPVSALDVSVQAQVLNLLDELKARLGLTYLFISHDLSVVETVCDRVAVMYFGRVVEIGPVRDIFARPRHPYTRLLLDSVPVPGRKPGVTEDANTELPDPYDPPPGCAFRARCPLAVARCGTDRPELDAGPHPVACWEAPPPQ
ncbi:peptide ABC transporter ATP-binding protein [Meridianimarinicoccus roseus]|uniref:Peptide ABC transporter ATP-binding protein n=1 Tax=Meridianimarinicoccus roseus TaxID=2072018 RepID=A0A2V2LAL3_9RHOB|nr:oligopeptide/dipeptide ABC transporter ATP-binding protein [Meridianimarinicoccus roseus]PWR02520.1 peptide ABC transporter ATP-binding protein [Meridianimarinicoccus roseus]